MAKKNRRGLFYILKGRFDNIDIYKYGATVNLKNRLKTIRCNYKIKFEPFFQGLFKDRFLAEKLFKWETWDGNNNGVFPLMGLEINGIKRYELITLKNGYSENEIFRVIELMKSNYKRN